MRGLRPVRYFVILALLACSGDDDGSAVTPPPAGQTLGSIATHVSSASLIAGSTVTITVIAYDTLGQRIPEPFSPVFSVPAAGAAIAEVDARGIVLGLGAGTTSVNVSLTIGAVTRTAAVVISVTGTMPAYATVSMLTSDAFIPDRVAIRRGGSVTWIFGPQTHGVSFPSSNPPGSPSGIPITSSALVSCTFSAAGDFRYTCVVHDYMSALVLVR